MPSGKLQPPPSSRKNSRSTPVQNQVGASLMLPRKLMKLRVIRPDLQTDRTLSRRRQNFHQIRDEQLMRLELQSAVS